MSRDRDTFDFMQHGERDRGRFGEREEPPRGRVTGASNLHDLDMILHVDKSRPAAVLVSYGDRTKGQWLPRSQIEILETSSPQKKLRGMIDQKVRVTLPEWLACAKGLI